MANSGTVVSTAKMDPELLLAELGPFHYLHTILEQTPNGVLVIGSNHRVIHANPAASHFLGSDYGELDGKFLSEIIQGAGGSFCERIAEICRNGSRETIEQELAMGDQLDRRVVRAVVTFPPATEGDYYLLYLINITQQKRLEVDLRRHNAFFHNLIDSSVDGIIASDMKGKIVIFNQGAQSLLGYSLEETTQLHVTGLYNEGYAYELIRRMRSNNYGGKGKLLRHELIVKHKRGHGIPVSFSGGIIYDGDNEIATFGIFTDLRALQQIEEDLEQTHRRLMQSEKMAGLGRLAAGVAHEINNPMSGIMLYANLVKEELGEEHQLATDLETIIHEAERCKVIVADLLEFSHQNTYEMEPVNLNEVVQKTLTILQHQPLFQNIEINRQFDPDLPPILGNSIRLNQVTMNIVVNAAQAMEGKGTIRILSRIRANKDVVELEISDSGPGIPDELLEKIFDPFFTTKATGEGTGLGLSVSYAIVKEHKGTIRVKSSAGNGTVFTLRFPAVLESLIGESHGEEQHIPSAG